MGMFDFFSMGDTCVLRKIDRYKNGDLTILTIDTYEVTDDTEYSYETGIECPKYNDGNWVIVEQYKAKGEAVKGHDKWIKVFQAEKWPDKLKQHHAGEFAKTFLGADGETVLIKE